MSPSDARERRRLSDLLGASVITDDGRAIGHVNDVRVAPGKAVRGVRAELLVEGLVISDRHAGSMLGYDRRAEQGPWLVRVVVRLMHRNAGYLPWAAVQQVSWARRQVIVDATALEPLSTP